MLGKDLGPSRGTCGLSQFVGSPRDFYGGWAVKNSRHNGHPRNTPLTLPDVLLG